ncbi:protein kinase [Aeromicrobium sp. UC242_57]|uniref:protein kinase domain-containing protein n=1 Tax=Aeromicrobium sp. UC242_57 TaxID=3374624 RepID=UPI0037B2FC19
MSDTWGLAGGDLIAPGLSAVKSVGDGDVYEAWLAFDERLYAPVIVKVVRPGHVDVESSRAGMLREVEMLSRLNHPGIVRLFAYDEEAERPYLVLENIDGPNLSSLISKHGYLPLHQLLPLGLRAVLGAALPAAHRHLSSRPEAEQRHHGRAGQLIDFSVAMDVKDAAALDHPVGSDEYMAPEQCRPGRARRGRPCQRHVGVRCHDVPRRGWLPGLRAGTPLGAADRRAPTRCPTSCRATSPR